MDFKAAKVLLLPFTMWFCSSSSWEVKVSVSLLLASDFAMSFSLWQKLEHWGCPLFGFLGPPQACPSSLLLDQRLWDAAERSDFFVSPVRLMVEPPSSVHPVACPQTSELNKWLLLVKGVGTTTTTTKETYTCPTFGRRNIGWGWRSGKRCLLI